MKKYTLRFDERVEMDILEAVLYYDSKSIGLGKRFYEQVQVAYEAIYLTPHFQIRYNNIRCLPVKIFPYMIHFEIDEVLSVITIRAIINCNRNPETNWLVNEP
jgi:hypothetical protein